MYVRKIPTLRRHYFYEIGERPKQLLNSHQQLKEIACNHHMWLSYVDPIHLHVTTQKPYLLLYYLKENRTYVVQLMDISCILYQVSYKVDLECSSYVEMKDALICNAITLKLISNLHQIVIAIKPWWIKTLNGPDIDLLAPYQ